MESSGLTTKSSNEILTELFGAFNAEPPKIETKRKISGSEEDNSEHSKRLKKSKSKKSKKKHKSKKHKRKRSEDGRDSESSSVKTSKKKSSRSKEKKRKKRNPSPNSVNIELPVNKVPMALEIMLDGTVGIKGEDGVVTKVPDLGDSDNNGSETEIVDEQTNVNGSVYNCLSEQDTGKTINNVENSKTDNKNDVSESKIPKMFVGEGPETGEKHKKGKIQIKDLKFSSVFQETVKAVEEQKKKEEEKKANYEEGELPDTTDDEQNSGNETRTGDKLESKSSKEHSRHRHRSHSKGHHHKRDDTHRSKRRSSRSRSRSHHRFHTRHHSYDRLSDKRLRSSSRDHHSFYHSRDGYTRHSPSLLRSHHSSGRSRENHRSPSRSRRSRSDERWKSRSSHRSKSKESKHHSTAKRSESVEKIDKEKLLAIARKNALKLIHAGVVPGAEKLTTIKAGGKTVNELTEYCKKLSEKEALGDDVSDIESESSEDEEKPFHHPFQVRDRPSSIIMNIKNSIPLPVKSLQEKAAEQAKQLRLQFPVSSGSSHRRTESEWVPVSPKREEVTVKRSPVIPTPIATPPPLLSIEKPPLLPPPQPLMPIYMTAVPPPQPPNKLVFPVIQPSPPVSKFDINSIVIKRLEAVRKLQENPNDSQALCQIYNAQQEMQYWAESKLESGAFTGSTGAKVLSASELSSGAQAWAKRDQLTSATPVKGGMGMALLQKMGWQPGEGLGKNKEGTLEPLRLEVKMDKKGLLAPDEFKKNRKGLSIQQGPPLPTVKTLDGKHPVSLLNELCSRRKYGVPQFELYFECGPDHKKNFLFKVKVNGIEYIPSVASPNKKQAKAEAAAICLRALGIISNA